MSRTDSIALSLIDVGDRFREDYGDIEALASSIKEKGVIQPITVRPLDGGRFLLLAGGRRIRACEAAGLVTIPALVRAASDGELDLREVELIENVMRKDLSWVERARLEARVYELKGSQRATAEALDESLGAVNRRLQLARAIEILPDLANANSEDEAWKKLKSMEEKVVLAELTRRAAEAGATQESSLPGSGVLTEEVERWQWADNHFKVGDFFEEIKDASPFICDFIEVDPPYAIDLAKLKRGKDAKSGDYKEVDPKEYGTFLAQTAAEVWNMLKNPGWVIWWYGPTWQEHVRAILKEVGFSVSEIPAIWCKGAQGQTNDPDTVLASTYEPFFICRKGRPLILKAGRSNVFHFDPVPHQKKIHPTERPVDLMVELLDTFVTPGGLIMSPFLGSGVTLLAAYYKKMSCFGWELSQEYKDRFMVQLHEMFGDADKV